MSENRRFWKCPHYSNWRDCYPFRNIHKKVHSHPRKYRSNQFVGWTMDLRHYRVRYFFSLNHHNIDLNSEPNAPFVFYLSIHLPLSPFSCGGMSNGSFAGVAKKLPLPGPVSLLGLWSQWPLRYPSLVPFSSPVWTAYRLQTMLVFLCSICRRI